MLFWEKILVLFRAFTAQTMFILRHLNQPQAASWHHPNPQTGRAKYCLGQLLMLQKLIFGRRTNSVCSLFTYTLKRDVIIFPDAECCVLKLFIFINKKQNKSYICSESKQTVSTTRFLSC